MINIFLIVKKDLLKILISTLLFNDLFDPSALVGQHIQRIDHWSSYAQDQEYLDYEETALSLVRFDDI